MSKSKNFSQLNKAQIKQASREGKMHIRVLITPRVQVSYWQLQLQCQEHNKYCTEYCF